MAKMEDEPKTFGVTTSGNMYQVKVSMLFLFRALKHRYSFLLDTEVKNAEKFDDTVFSYIEDERIYLRCLQAKHSTDPSRCLQYKDFATGKDFNLEKYFISFRKIKQKYGHELKDLLICTDIPLKELTLKNNENDPDNKALIFQKYKNIYKKDIFFDKHGSQEWDQHKLTSISKELKEKFNKNTNLSLLSQYLANTIFNNKENITAKTFNIVESLDMENYWISSYYEALVNDKIIETQYPILFKGQFLNSRKERKDMTEKMKLKLSTQMLNELNEVKYELEAEMQYEKCNDNDLWEFVLLNHINGNDNLEPFLLENICRFKKYPESGNIFGTFVQTSEDHLVANLDRLKWIADVRFEKILESSDSLENRNDKMTTEFELADQMVKHLINKSSLSDQEIFKKNASFLKNIIQINENGRIKTAHIITDKENRKLGHSFSESEKTFSSIFARIYICHKLMKTLGTNCDILNNKKNFLDRNEFVKQLSKFSDANRKKFVERLIWNFKELKEIVCIKERIVFTEDFIKGANPNINAQDFREMFLQKCASHVCSVLQQKRIEISDDVEDFLNKQKEKNRTINRSIGAPTFVNRIFSVLTGKLPNDYTVGAEKFVKQLAECFFYEKILGKDDDFKSHYELMFYNFKFIEEHGRHYMQLADNFDQKFANDLLVAYVLIILKFKELKKTEEKADMKKFADIICEAKRRNSILDFGHRIYDSYKNEVMLSLFDSSENNLIKFKESFFNDEDNSLSYNEKMLKKELKAKLNNNLEPLKTFQISLPFYNFCFESNASKLADEIFNLKTENKRGIVLKYVRRPETKGIIEALNGTVFVATGELNRIKFKNSFFYSNDLPRAVTAFREQLKSKMNLKKLKKYEIEIENYPFACDTLIENGDIKNDIEEFYRKLLIAQTPNENEIIKYIGQELAREVDPNFSNFILDCLFVKMLNWSKKIDGKFLNEKEAAEFIDDIKSLISKAKIESFKKVQCFDEFKICNVKTPIIDLQKFLKIVNPNPSGSEENLTEVENKNQILHIISLEPKLTALKAKKTLQWQSKNSYIINYISTMNSWDPDLPFVYRLEDEYNWLIIIDDEKICDYETFFKNICITMCNQNKKVVLITKEISTMAENFVENFIYTKKKNSKKENLLNDEIVDIFVKRIKDEIVFDDFSNKTQKSIKNTSINFNGRNITLNHLVSDHGMQGLTADDIRNKTNKFYGSLSSSMLMKLITEKNFMIPQSEREYDRLFYIRREICVKEFKVEILSDEEVLKENLFLIEGETLDNAKECLKKAFDVDASRICDAYNLANAGKICKYILTEKNRATSDFRILCQNLPNWCIHWLKIYENKFMWVHSNKFPESLDFSKWLNIKSVILKEKTFLEHVSMKPTIFIADYAGTGKTSLLNQMFNEILEKGQQVWMVKIDLKSSKSTLDHLQKLLNTSTPNELNLNFNNVGKLIDMFNCGKTHVELKSDLGHFIFQHLLDIGRVIVMFDGFDSACMDYVDVLAHLFNELQKKVCVWITSRVNFKNELEKLHTAVYSLVPFTNQDQINFLQKYWRNENISCRKECAQSLTHVFYAKYWKNFLETPFRLEMVAKTFTEACKTKIADNKQLETCFYEKAKNLFDLHEYFAKTTLERFCSTFIPDITTNTGKYALSLSVDSYKKQHGKLGLKAFCAGIVDQNLLEYLGLEDLISLYKNGGLNAGLIDMINENDHILFNHQTYAEYFAAFCLVKNLSSVAGFLILEQILKEENYVFKECLKHLIIKHNSHILNSSEGKKLVKCNEFLNSCRLENI